MVERAIWRDKAGAVLHRKLFLGLLYFDHLDTTRQDGLLLGQVCFLLHLLDQVALGNDLLGLHGWDLFQCRFIVRV